MSNWGFLERLRPAEIELIRDRRPVVFVPWGALEWHGPHAPVGLDGLKAHGVCARVATLTGGVVLPPIWLGTGTLAAAMDAPHCVEFTSDIVSGACTQLILALSTDWAVVVIVAGHYGDDQMAALRAAVEDARGLGAAAQVILVADWETSGGVSPRDHAAAGETAMLLELHPELVDLDALPVGRALTVQQDGVWGDDPRSSGPSDGRRMVDATVAGLVRLVLYALEQVA